MTSTIGSSLAPAGRSPSRTGRIGQWRRLAARLPLVWMVALGAVALRLPLLSRPPSPDEAGFLLVGGQWHGSGASLYGDYWVDRPPLLITVFRFAAEAGGLVPLRLIGCAATVLTVLGVARLAGQLGGRRAAGWAAVSTGVLLVGPFTGAQSVNGELLAAPIVIWGLVAVAHALRDDRHATRAAVLAGVALVCSMGVKQNFADVAVFAAAAGAIAVLRRELPAARARALLGGFALGAVVALAAVCLWTVVNGSSLSGVYDAMFPFRLQAGRLLTSPANHGSRARLVALLVAWLFCGGAAAMAVSGLALWRRLLGGTLVWALVATIVFETVSVLAGGSYWHHYLIQVVGPLSVLVGAAAARGSLSARAVVLASVVAGTVGWVVALPWQTSSLAADVGSAVGRAAAPDDTIVTLYGHADVDLTARLRSPYPYLWSLPTKTRDPQLQQLTEVLSGPEAPTWVVTWSRLHSWGVDSSSASRVLSTRYRPVARLAGRTVYLHTGVDRTTPVLRGPVPRVPPLITTVLEELLP